MFVSGSVFDFLSSFQLMEGVHSTSPCPSILAGGEWWHMCHGQKSRFYGDGRPPTFNDWNPYNGQKNPTDLG